MIGSPIAMVVDADAHERRHTEEVLERVRFVVMAADSFADARALLASMTPDIVVADIKLHAFNGLHLAALCSIWRPGTPFIATYERFDRVLEADAARLNALYIAKTPGRDELTRAAFTLLDARLHGATGVRRSFRKPAPVETVARVATERADLVDVSYGGIKLKLRRRPSGTERGTPPDSFEIVFPALDLSLSAARIWASPDDAADVWLCGADLSQNQQNELERWRRFVDSVV